MREMGAPWAFSPEYAGRCSPDLGLPREEGRGSLEDVSLLLEPGVLMAQPAQLLPLIAGRPVIALTDVALGLVDASSAASAGTRPSSQPARSGCAPPTAAPRPRGGTARGMRVGFSALQTPSFRAINAQATRCPQERGKLHFVRITLRAYLREARQRNVRSRREHAFALMCTRASFDRTAPLGRISLLIGAYAPVLAILGLRIGLSTPGLILIAVAALGTAWWLWFLLRVTKRRQTWDITIDGAEPIDRDVTGYVASYLLPVLAAKPEHATGYIAYGLAAVLILVVAYRADLGAINPIAYLCGYRVYRVSAVDGVRVVLSRSLLVKGTTWQLQEAAGIVITASMLPGPDNNEEADDSCRPPD